MAEKLVNDFKINFEKPAPSKAANRTSGPLGGDKAAGKNPADLDKKLKKWTKQVFSRPRKRHHDANGNPVKYYKDNSIPIMFKKILPPSGKKLPLLHFKYHENGKLCKCKCRL